MVWYARDKVLEKGTDRRLHFFYRFRKTAYSEVASAGPVFEVIDFKEGRFKLFLNVLDPGCILIDSGS